MQAKVFRALGTRKLTKIQYFNQSSSLSKEEVYYSRSSPFIVRYFENGHLVNESFLSKNGYCYLKQEINPKTGRYSGFWSWGVDGEVKFYKSIWDWRRDFVRDVVCAKSTENILLCDGNNVPPQFLRMRNERFRVFAVIHMNHRGTNDKLRKHYAAYFDRLGEFDGVICLTEEQAQELRREFSVNDSLFVVPNRIASLDRSVVMAEQRIYDATVISRLETGKGVEDAVDAFKFVVDRLPSAQLSIFGSGSERERIEKAVIRNGLRDNVTLRGVTSAPMLEMSRSKVFMFTSESEGFGLTIAEAMSSGAPVVAFDCKYGPASLISNGMNGFLVQGRSNFELADNVVRLLDDDLMRSEFSHKSMEWFDNNLSDSAIMQRWNLAFNLK
ncbi:glycosyltransferase [Glutamicibacter sp. M10]|uniref:glycosyltransferase n=1 Tax=Glutamicibacter sp. M10 TaxID=3023076 RepID=UPI0021C6A897|nr:glycosyltransferase [Glutamicibacter sp. M10]UXN31277.1 glycosyltransferase [Glutamicibacter sp. M10]